MKKLIPIMLALMVLIGTAAFSQETAVDKVVVPFSDATKPGLVEVNVLSGSITVKGYSGKEVIIEAKAREKSLKEGKKAPKGMKLIASSATGLSVEEEKNVMKINVESWKRTIDVVVQVPISSSLKLESVNRGKIIVDKIKGDLEVRNVNGSITLTNIEGNVVASTVNGPVKVALNKVNSKKPMSFVSFNGDVDITLPKGIKADFKMKTSQGDIYSDFEVLIKKTPNKVVNDKKKKGGKYKITFDKTIYGTVNGGGPDYSFKTFNGDIFIREKK